MHKTHIKVSPYVCIFYYKLWPFNLTGLVTQYLCKGVTFGRHWLETTDVLLVILFRCDSEPYAIAKFNIRYCKYSQVNVMSNFYAVLMLHYNFWKILKLVYVVHQLHSLLKFSKLLQQLAKPLFCCDLSSLISIRYFNLLLQQES